MSARVLVIGIDCLSPDLVLDRWRGKLPTLASLMRDGSYGPLRSTDPPITVPAWASMLTGRDPGELGLYGFHVRGSAEPFDSGRIVTGHDVSFPWVWDLVGEAGEESLVVGVPPTWPPRPMRGRLLTDFLTPDTSVPFTWPPELSSKIEEDGGGSYLLDLPDHRGLEPVDLIEQAGVMAERRFSLFTRWLASSDPALALIMEIGLDRMQHALWHYMDPAHPRYPGPGNELENALFDYHLLLDGLIARAVDAAGPKAHVLVVSDHGAQAMMGGVRLNEWLRRQGHLVVTAGPNGEPPDEIPWGTPLARCAVDWKRSRAFAEGGYCGRVYLNLEGRQQEGCVSPEDFEPQLESLSRGLLAIAGPDGAPLSGTEVHRPQDLYREIRGHPPDLLVYFGGLAWRALGTVGTAPCGRDVPDPDSILSLENDTGPDGANHAMEGVFVLREAGAAPGGRVEGMGIHDVFATILGLLGIQAPDGTLGTCRRVD